MRPIFIDFETRSDVDVGLGGRAYARGAQSEVICCVALIPDASPGVGLVVAWSPWRGPASRPDGRPGFRCPGAPPVPVGARAARPWQRLTWEAHWEREDPPASVAAALRGRTLVAHNAHNFDRHIWEALGWPEAPWADSIDRTRRAALGGALDACAQRVYGQGKDETGHKLMMRHAKPHRTKREQVHGEFLDPSPSALSGIVTYCARDVLLLAALWYDGGLGLPHVDDPALALHERIHERGVPMDLDYTRRIGAAVDRIVSASIARAVELAGIDPAMIRSPSQLLEWLRTRGYDLADVEAATLEVLQVSDPQAAAVIEARLAWANVVSGKVAAILARTCPDGRMRDWSKYYGAHTGRWAGVGAQLQNFPREGEQ